MHLRESRHNDTTPLHNHYTLTCEDAQIFQKMGEGGGGQIHNFI